MQLLRQQMLTTQKRLELSTFAVTGRRSNQLSHWAIPEDNNLYLQNRTLKLYLLYLNFHPIFLSKTFGQALDRLVNVS